MHKIPDYPTPGKSGTSASSGGYNPGRQSVNFALGRGVSKMDLGPDPW